MIFERMRQETKFLLKKIHQHPFNIELAQGRLDLSKFIYYLIQDSLYLVDFSKALAITAARLPERHDSRQYMQFALGAIEAENQLHLDFLADHKVSNLAAHRQSPACFMYTNYLLKIASLASVEEAVASLLPCFWIYSEVGKKIAAMEIISNNPFQDWIDLYASDAFAGSVESAIDTVNMLGQQASETIKNNMLSAFIKATELEWLFWDSAYALQEWR